MGAKSIMYNKIIVGDKKRMLVVLLLADVLVFQSSSCQKKSLNHNLGEKGPMNNKKNCSEALCMMHEHNPSK